MTVSVMEMAIFIGILSVFPAYAGVIPVVDLSLVAAAGLSRIRGGDPVKIPVFAEPEESFPHTRG
ncbi:hypothetical protein [Gardnerella pickettii]|uniref:hypothetical protein n=1 Tax=Gardnerella pickettii TaxID=2914924 RepID=UPI0011AE64B1|nr:hypothetical protein [Gardnerella pickettii]